MFITAFALKQTNGLLVVSGENGLTAGSRELPKDIESNGLDIREYNTIWSATHPPKHGEHAWACQNTVLGTLPNTATTIRSSWNFVTVVIYDCDDVCILVISDFTLQYFCSCWTYNSKEKTRYLQLVCLLENPVCAKKQDHTFLSCTYLFCRIGELCIIKFIVLRNFIYRISDFVPLCVF